MNMPSTKDDSRGELSQSSKSDFITAARRRWQQLEEELRSDVAEFNSSKGDADFLQFSVNQFRVSNSKTGLQLTITANFDEQTIRYGYEQVSNKSAGAPEGGILSMRECQPGAVEFYSADEQLTSDEARRVLLEPVLFPPEMAA